MWHAARQFRRILALAMSAFLLVPSPVWAMTLVQLKQPTVAAFDRYVKLREAQLETELQSQNAFLWVDRLPNAERAEAYEKLRRGEVVIERMKMRDEKGQEIECPDGLIHHWMGTVFVPGVTLKQAIDLVQDYDRHATHYAPEVLASKTLERDGNNFKIHMRFLKKKVITIVVDTYQDVRYVPLNGTRLHSRAITTSVREVEHAGKPDERQKPEGNDGGFLWRLYSYWLFDERDGGVYVQCEAISLTRDIPFLLKWLKPFLTTVPRESLIFTLGTTRRLLTGQPTPSSAP